MTNKSIAVSDLSLRLSLPLLCSLLLLVALFILHISIGSKPITTSVVMDALLHYDAQQFDHIVIWQLRLPRAVIALVVGASLSVAGALMQGVTRNPLADPGILGLLHGASLTVVVLVSIFAVNNVLWLPLFAAIGALLAAVLVWLIAVSAPGGASPLTLILSGAAVTTFLSAFIALIKLIDESAFDSLRVWLTGSLAGRDLLVLWWCLPWLLVGFAIALLISPQVTAFAMGEETATGLGVKPHRLKILVLMAVITLTAPAVALAGPMGFVGLVIPHVVRLFFGYDYRYIVPYSAIIGSAYLLTVDIVARVALSPMELSTGIVTSLLGAPLFVWLVRARL